MCDEVDEIETMLQIDGGHTTMDMEERRGGEQNIKKVTEQEQEEEREREWMSVNNS